MIVRHPDTDTRVCDDPKRISKELSTLQQGEEAHFSHLVGSLPSPGLRCEPYEPSKDGGSRTQPLPERNAVIAIAVVDTHSFTRECITKSLQELSTRLDIVAFANCDDCLRGLRPHDLILYHAHESIAKQPDEQRAADIKKLQEIASVVILCDVDCVDSVHAAFESGARGYIPTASTTLELAIEVLHLIKAGGTFVPASTLLARGINRQGATRGAIGSSKFTHRQMAVLDRLSLGKSNKIIAHELEMSESTVKVHIRNIMKKLNAKNRTEVAYRAHELGICKTHSTPLNDRSLVLAENGKV